VLRHVSRASMSRLGFLFSQNCRTLTQVNAKSAQKQIFLTEPKCLTRLVVMLQFEHEKINL